MKSILIFLGLPVSAGSPSCIFTENFDKMAFTGKTQSGADLRQGAVRIQQHGFGCFQAFSLKEHHGA